MSDAAFRDPYAPRPIDLPTAVPLEPGADLRVLDEAKILAAPDDPADRPAWRATLRRWREQARVGYDDERYRDPATRWAATAWNVALVWLWDEAVRDWDAERFDADRLLATYADVGGLDAVVLWHAYPVIGVDERNQFDWYDVPGLRGLVEDLHERGVRVCVDYNPWDVGTRRTGRTDAVRLAELVTSLGADGVFLDTLKEGDPELLAALGGLDPRPVLEGESRVPLARIEDHQASWAQWFADSDVPGVLRARWFEQRHQVHHTRRWNRDHAAELRSAWVNGAGVLLWDVVFGVRVDWGGRDRATLRAMREVYRRLGRFLTEGEWEPLTDLAPEATAAGVAGSRWRLGGCSLLTLANPTSSSYDGPLLRADPEELHVVVGDGAVPAGGVAGVVHVPAGVPAPAGLAGGGWPGTGGDARPVEPPAPRRGSLVPAPGAAVAGGVVVPAGPRELTVQWRQRETGLYETAPYVEDWKPLPPRLHQLRSATRAVSLPGCVVDPRLVSNADYARFLSATGHRPRVAHRLLQHWQDGQPVAGTEDEPVRFVDVDDARAYASWRGARLPTEDEWQVAAGLAGFARQDPLVWEWTDSEHRDGRTRWLVLKGGSSYAAEGSPWYLDGGPKPPEWSVRYLLTGAGTSRSSRVGFRCAVDLPGAGGVS